MLVPRLAAATASRLIAYAGSLLAMIEHDAAAQQVRQVLATIALDEDEEGHNIDPLLAISLTQVALMMLDRSGHGASLMAIYLQQSLEIASDLNLPSSSASTVSDPT